MPCTITTDAVHVKVYEDSATVTELANAGKVGKKCRVLRFRGSPSNWQWQDNASAGQKAAAIHTGRVLAMLSDPKSVADGFDTIRERVRDKVAVARGEGAELHSFNSYDEEIKGIDAPQPPLTHGVEGEWYVGADHNGISCGQHDVNQWRDVTSHRQTNAQAYRIAKKVWDKVKQAKTYHEATEILRAAGAKLHGYCGTD